MGCSGSDHLQTKNVDIKRIDHVNSLQKITLVFNNITAAKITFGFSQNKHFLHIAIVALFLLR